MTSKLSSDSKEDDVSITIDFSVRNEILNELRNRGVMPEMESIEPFQFKVSEEIGGFIKTFQELYELIKKNEFFKNAELLRKQFLRPVLILEEGDMPDLDRNNIIETWATLFVQFDIPIILSRNVKDTVKLLLTIIRREKSDKVTRITTRMTKAPTEFPELQIYILKGIPGINDELAKRLLMHFKTLENLANAKPGELMQLKGIGKTLAEKLHVIFTSLYKLAQQETENDI
ncbi:MAG: helix-hairpin-helix domain-containing protein [Promethearchaeota archaeon]